MTVQDLNGIWINIGEIVLEISLDKPTLGLQSILSKVILLYVLVQDL